MMTRRRNRKNARTKRKFEAANYPEQKHRPGERGTNNRTGGRGERGGFRGWSGKISEGKSGYEPTTESGGRLLASIEVTTRYFETSFASVLAAMKESEMINCDRRKYW